MSEEEMERAEEINQQREEEYRIHQERLQYRIYSDVESAPTIDNSFVSINNPSAVRPKETIIVPVAVAVESPQIQKDLPPECVTEDSEHHAVKS